MPDPPRSASRSATPVVINVGDEVLLGESSNGNQRWMLATLQNHGLPAGLALCLQSLEFQTGTRHEYQYMNGKRFESQQVSFPKCVYDEGLMDSLTF